MVEFFIRLAGAALGFLATHVVLMPTLLVGSGGEGSIAGGMWFWCGRWLIVLFGYVTGIVAGYFLSVPMISKLGIGFFCRGVTAGEATATSD